MASSYDKLCGWAYKTGQTIKEHVNGEDLLRKLIFNIRAEETPGRFLDKLSQTIVEYRTNRNIGLNIDIHKDLAREEQPWYADRFHYMKAAVLIGFANALSYKSRRR